MRLRTTTMGAVMGAAVAILAFSGCEREGPAERAGERIDRGVEKAGDSLERAGDRAQDRVDR
ncbi:hypothetical protein SVA_2303 [Sulfurifustis variabilis]|uniref:Uncharacterized protein n=1 Tax=Sulfurifustis variabilis TaxID=1675686 RepID=A0A1B4V5N5_9GAMM|nr:hypothetical protein [Sulfurifustis variabilis]BAU48853.1 hypothetical protein SVA_2303 [Sulfurifustis variabilis]